MHVCTETATDTERRADRLKVSPSQQKVIDVLVIKRRHGVHGVTAGEVREMLEQIHAPRRFDKGWATGRLDELKDLGLVAQSEERRLNPLTGRTSMLWFVPASQARLFS
jgi:Cdc6-like AAA superfamily ATPase